MKDSDEIPYHHQIPPYGALGQPYIVTKHDLVYPHTASRLNWSCLEKKRLNEQLNKCFPYVFVKTHSWCLILNSLIQIALQIALMCTNGALWWVASGIWGGVYFLVTALLTLLLIKFRNYWLFIVVYCIHIFGILVAIGAYLIVNVIAIAEYRDNCSYYPKCFNEAVRPLNYIMFFIGVICIIQLMIYLILMPFYIMDVFNQCKKYKNQSKHATISTSSVNISNISDRKSTQITHAQVLDADMLKHSILYAQNNLDENSEYISNSPLKVKNIIIEYDRVQKDQV